MDVSDAEDCLKAASERIKELDRVIKEMTGSL
jgi:hypothetical protein